MDANFTKLMIDTANGVNADNFSLADSNTAIRKRFSEILKLPEELHPEAATPSNPQQ